MGAQELSKAVLFAVHAAAGHAVLAAFVSLFLLHECIRVLRQLLTHALMILEIGLQRRMVVYELRVFRQRRIAAKLFGDFPVFVKKLIEAHGLAMVGATRVLAMVVVLTVFGAVTHVVAICVAVSGVTIPSVAIAAIVVASAGVISVVVPPSVVAICVAVSGVTIPSVAIAAIVVTGAGVISVVVPPSVVAIKITIASVSVAFVVIEAVFLPHEGIRILIQSLLHVRMLLQISLQRWMGLQELLIFYQRWIAPKLFGGFAVTVKEAIELCQLGAATIVLTVCVSISVTVAV